MFEYQLTSFERYQHSSCLSATDRSCLGVNNKLNATDSSSLGVNDILSTTDVAQV